MTDPKLPGPRVSLKRLDLSVRTRRILEEAGCRRVADVRKRSLRSWESIRGAGSVTMEELQTVIGGFPASPQDIWFKESDLRFLRERYASALFVWEHATRKVREIARRIQEVENDLDRLRRLPLEERK